MTEYYNPLISGFHPDPSVVRVGDDYYIATSTFEYVPGIPIFHSRDFETWTRIGHVATTAEQLGVSDVQTAGGAWAPTIRHRDGVFHVIITVAMGRGMLHFTATDPAGPWSAGDVILNAAGTASVDGIDPDLAWDDEGTAYVTYSALVLTGEDVGQHRGIEQVRVDLDTHRALEEPRSLWSGTGLKFPEAPHLYEHGGYWYLVIAEGGTERGHGMSVARSDSPAGPFVGGPGNPVVSARSTSRPIQNTGHGDLVEGPDGWLAVLLGVRPTSMTQAFSALGRETFVTPVRWVDGWLEIDPVELNPRRGTAVFSDDFDEPEFGLDWIGVRRRPDETGSLTERPGSLVLHADGSTLDDSRPVFVGLRQEHLRAAVTATFDVSAGVGGLGVRYDERFHYEIEAGRGRIVARASVGGIRQEWTRPFSGASVTLHLDVRPDETPGIGGTSDTVVLGATIDGERIDLAEVDGRFLSSETTESFVGRVIGVYAVDGTVAVDRVAYEGSED
ncbi:glycoside hydrolase family 43 protein [Agromyces atrinae]|uniref:glycoside hydrolase family 43 protein n=1 Tax=Agromyces atrinae TaxID=592376 RepID=UPI001F5A013D|nr:glycoside hydrolase family 43 protein [Agromyces atrinae]MCI2957056.1 glycoside hydrolase family 43 protein [Agromyces atrinae]